MLRLKTPLLMLMIALCAAIMPVQARSSANRSEAVTSYNRGVQLFSEGHNAEALTEFRRSRALGHVPNVHGPLGQLLFLDGSFGEAAAELSQATSFEPGNAALWCQLGISSSRTGNFESALTAFQRYLALEPNGSYSSEARRSVQILSGTLASPVGAPEPSQQLACVTPRWQTRTLNVFIQSSADPAKTALVASALEHWTQLSDRRVQFHLVQDAQSAQIQVGWTDNAADMDSSDELGTTALRLDSGGSIAHARITLLTGKNNELTLRRAYAVALHEIGHARGLGHSSQPDDLMYATVAPAGLELGPTEHDRQTLLALYR